MQYQTHAHTRQTWPFKMIVKCLGYVWVWVCMAGFKWVK